jgi:hypothetical protein
MRTVPTSVLALGVAAALLASATSLLGLLAAWPYAAETANWSLQARGQDVGNVVAVAALLTGVPLLRAGRLLGWVLWIGSLLYLVYAFVIYAFGVHFGPLFPAYVAVLELAAYALLFSVGPGVPTVRRHKADRFAAGLVTAIAAAFALLWLSSIIGDLLAGTSPSALVESGLPTNQVQVLDLALVLPGMLITAGTSRQEGRVLLLGSWLVFAALMSASIVATLLLSAAPVGVVAALTAIIVASTASVGWQAAAHQVTGPAAG